MDKMDPMTATSLPLPSSSSPPPPDARPTDAERSTLFGAMAAIHMKHVAPAGLPAHGDEAASPSFHRANNERQEATTPRATDAGPATGMDESAAVGRAPSGASGGGRGRPRMGGKGRQANQSLRRPITYAHKLAVIDFFAAHGRDINATVREFYAHLSPTAVGSRKRQIYKWVKEREVIEAMCFKQSTAAQSRRRARGTATTLSADAERELVAWIHAEAAGGGDASGLSTRRVRDQALALAAREGLPPGAFQATWSWQKGFLKRHHIVP